MFSSYLKKNRSSNNTGESLQINALHKKIICEKVEDVNLLSRGRGELSRPEEGEMPPVLVS